MKLTDVRIDAPSNSAHNILCDIVAYCGIESVLFSLSEIVAAQQSVQPTLLTRCPKCNAVTGWHHPLCEDYSPESQSG